MLGQALEAYACIQVFIAFSSSCSDKKRHETLDSFTCTSRSYPCLLSCYLYPSTQESISCDNSYSYVTCSELCSKASTLL